jgi:hypothetical protein
MTARILKLGIRPLNPAKHRFILTRAAEDLAKAERAHRKGAGVAEARRALILTQARFLAHDVAQRQPKTIVRKGATVGRSDQQPTLFEVNV